MRNIQLLTLKSEKWKLRRCWSYSLHYCHVGCIPTVFFISFYYYFNDRHFLHGKAPLPATIDLRSENSSQFKCLWGVWLLMVTSFYKSVIGSCSRVRKVINSCCCTARQAPKTSGDQRTRRFISQIIKTILSTLLKSLFILVAEVHVRMNCRR